MFKRLIVALALSIALLAPLSHRAMAADTAGQGAADVEQGQGHGAKPELLPSAGARETQLHALWVVIIFVVLLAVLYPTAWKNVLAGLKAREERIRKDIADAEAARARAEATLRDYNAQLATAEGKVRDMVGAAVVQGEKAATEIRMRAQAEAEEGKARVMREIESARKQALSEIYASAADISTSIAEKILRRNINAADQRELVQSSLDQLQAVEK